MRRILTLFTRGKEGDWREQLKRAEEELRRTYWGKAEDLKSKSAEERQAHTARRQEAASKVIGILAEHPGPWSEVADNAWSVYQDPANREKRFALSQQVISNSALDEVGQWLAETYLSARMIRTIQPRGEAGRVNRETVR